MVVTGLRIFFHRAPPVDLLFVYAAFFFMPVHLREKKVLILKERALMHWFCCWRAIHFHPNIKTQKEARDIESHIKGWSVPLKCKTWLYRFWKVHTDWYSLFCIPHRSQFQSVNKKMLSTWNRFCSNWSSELRLISSSVCVHFCHPFFTSLIFLWATLRLPK